MIQGNGFSFEILTSSGIVGSFVAVIALAVLYECLKGIHTILKAYRKKEDPSRIPQWNTEHRDGLNKRQKVLTEFSNTCLYVVQLSVGYFLMLVTYTYNTYLFMAVVIGHGLGYYLISPLVIAYSKREEIGDYYHIRRDLLFVRRKRQPLITNTDI
ncbi:probable low affinity copper uptake protein 2 [Stylophora pistillata]|uniref:probable low affinity copper uptake protein 2 n=1 Tax=Stylophora pistillata TaxID=50429 RepID=UPI000C054291|nr:probable low affinity copper uptake protein 2 [Stylophora pistillata]